MGPVYLVFTLFTLRLISPADIAFLRSCFILNRVRNKKEQIKQFWESGDFGIISDKKTHMTSVCTNEKPVSRLLEASEELKLNT